MPLPLEIIGLGRDTVEMVWEDEHRSVFPARELRLMCRCAHCIEEMTGEKLLDPARVPADIRVENIALVGQYAIGIAFTDGHSTGLYNFRDLREQCPCDECSRRRGAQSVGK